MPAKRRIGRFGTREGPGRGAGRAVSNLWRQRVWGGGKDAAAAAAPDTGGLSVRRRRRVRERAGESQIGIKGAAFPSDPQFSSTSSTQDKMKCIVSISSRRKLRTAGCVWWARTWVGLALMLVPLLPGQIKVWQNLLWARCWNIQIYVSPTQFRDHQTQPARTKDHCRGKKRLPFYSKYLHSK